MPSDRVDWLLTVVEQQQQRLSILEGLVEHLCTQILCKPTPLPPTKPSTNQDQLPPPILATSGEGANYSESINLSESLKRLTSQLESKLRASDTFGAAACQSPPFRSSPRPSASADDDNSALRLVTTTESPPLCQPAPATTGALPHVQQQQQLCSGSCNPSPRMSTHATRHPTVSSEVAQHRLPATAYSAGNDQQTRMLTPDSSSAASRRRPMHGAANRHGEASRSSRPASAGASRIGSDLNHVTTLQGGTQPVTGIAVSECGSGLIAAGLDGQLQLWTLGLDDPSGLGTTLRSAHSWRRTLTLPVGGGEINALALRGSILVCGCQDGSVRLYRLFKEQSTFVLYSLLRKQHSASRRGGFGSASVDSAAFAAATSVDDCAGSPIAAVDAAKAGAAAASAPSEVMCVALSSSVHSGSRTAPLLASGAQDGTVCLWDSSSGRLLQQLQAHEYDGSGWVMAMVLDRHENSKSGLMLTASYDQTIRVWSHEADEILGYATGGNPLSGNSGLAASSSFWGGSFNSAGSGSWVLRQTLKGHTDGVLGLELSRTRRHAFSASNDHSVRVWELSSGACLQDLRLHECSVSALGWHLASGCLATGAEDGSVHLWDVSAFDDVSGARAQAELVQTLSIDHCEILCIAPSADGTALFCGLDDGTFALLGAA